MAQVWVLRFLVLWTFQRVRRSPLRRRMALRASAQLCLEIWMSLLAMNGQEGRAVAGGVRPEGHGNFLRERCSSKAESSWTRLTKVHLWRYPVWVQIHFSPW